MVFHERIVPASTEVSFDDDEVEEVENVDADTTDKTEDAHMSESGDAQQGASDPTPDDALNREHTFKPRRSQRTKPGLSARYRDNASIAMFTGTVSAAVAVPSSLEDALASPYRDEWVAAMCAEMKSIRDLDVYEVVTPPSERDLVTCKWVFDLKRDENGNIL